MRTRRSPRNQEILFRALFKAPDQSAPAEPTLDERIAATEAALSDMLSPRNRRYYERQLAALQLRVRVRDAIRNEK